MTDIESYVKHWFETTNDEVHCVCYGVRYKDWKPNHNEWGIVFNVLKKKTKKELAPGELLPDKINIKGQVFKTDVIECPQLSQNYCQYAPDDPNLQWLQGTPNFLKPMKGGQEIVQFPTRWTRKPDGKFSCGRGTLGFFAIDNYDNRLIGVTNAHVATANYSIPSDRGLENQTVNTYNCRVGIPWYNINPKACFFPTCAAVQDYIPGLDLSGDVVLFYPFSGVKRFMPLFNQSYNYVDCGILVPNSSNGIDYFNDFSYQQWQPIGSQQYQFHMPFATTAELNNLPGQNIRVYATGRTTGPKGYGSNPQCWMTVTGVHGYQNITTIDGNQVPFADCLIYNWVYPAYPYADVRVSAPGDSGSCILGDINGVRKIIGLNFAGTPMQGIANRIDQVASTMNIRAWESGGLPNKTESQGYVQVRANSDGYGDIARYESEGKIYWNMGIVGQECLVPARPTPTPVIVINKPVVTFPEASPEPDPTMTPLPTRPDPTPPPPVCGQCFYQYIYTNCDTLGYCAFTYDAFFKFWEFTGGNCGKLPCECTTNVFAVESGQLPATGFNGQTKILECYSIDENLLPNGTWEYIGNDCENGFCICPENPKPFYEGPLYPNTVGVAQCDFILSPTPSSTPFNCGVCEWTWNGVSWNEVSRCISEDCSCQIPFYQGDFSGQIAFTNCTQFVTATPTPTGTNATLTPTKTPVPSGTEPTPTPSGTEPTPTPSGTGPTPAPSGTGPTPTPSGTGPTPTPSGTEPTPTPSGTGPTPTPSGTGPTPTPSGTEPTPTPSGTGPTPTPIPSGTEPTPAPSGTGPTPTPIPSNTSTTPTPTGTDPTQTPSATSSCSGVCTYIAAYVGNPPTLQWLYLGDTCVSCGGGSNCTSPETPPTNEGLQIQLACDQSV